jgi:hypothetical protein
MLVFRCFVDELDQGCGNEEAMLSNEDAQPVQPCLSFVAAIDNLLEYIFSFNECKRSDVILIEQSKTCSQQIFEMIIFQDLAVE